MSKYYNVKTTIDGIRFDSKMEAAFYVHLRQLEKAGALKLIETQPKTYLTGARILYKPDFLTSENGAMIYYDVKGFATPVFNLKKRLWRCYGPHPLRLVKLVKKNHFEVFEEVVPKQIET